MDNRRGVIRNRKWGTQVRDYSGLRFGNITPTDLDGLIEYKGLAYVMLETKYRDAEMPYGQRLALERLSDDLTMVKPNIVVVCSHNNESDIDVANAIVCQYRFRGPWHIPNTETKTADLVGRFLHWAEFEQHKP